MRKVYTLRIQRVFISLLLAFLLPVLLPSSALFSQSSRSCGPKIPINFLNKTAAFTFKILGFGIVAKQFLMPLDGSEDDSSQPPEIPDGGELVTIQTLDQVNLRALFFPPKGVNGVVVMFHGNGMTGDSWLKAPVFRWFRAQGLGVIAPTIRGYPGSTGSCRRDFDKSLLLDTEAVVRFLREGGLGTDKIAAFGLSLGGAYATTLAHYFRTPLILHNSWSRFEEIVERCSNLPSWFSKAVGNACSTWTKSLPILSDLGMYEEKGLSAENLTYDFGDNLRKLAIERDSTNPIDVLVIYAEDDELMDGETGARKIFEARYPKGSGENRLISVPGNHCSTIGCYSDAFKDWQMLEEFLKTNGTIRNS